MAIFTITTGSGTVANYVIIKQDDGNSGVLQSVTPAECLTYNLYNSDTGSADTSRGFYITGTNRRGTEHQIFPDDTLYINGVDRSTFSPNNAFGIYLQFSASGLI